MKKFITVLFSLLIATVVFAQEVKSAGVTDSDAKNYAKNFKSISKELEKLNDSDFDKMDAIFSKYGISGPNRFEKFSMITACAEVAVYDYTLASDPSTAAIMKSMGMDPMAETRKRINQKDYDVVNANVELFLKLMK